MLKLITGRVPGRHDNSSVVRINSYCVYHLKKNLKQIRLAAFFQRSPTGGVFFQRSLTGDVF